MPWRVGALTRALLCGDSRWYRPLSGLGWYGNGSVAVDGGDEKKGRFALVQDFMVGLRCCFARTISNMCYRTLLSSRTITTTHRCPRRPSTTFRRARFSPMLQRCQNRGQCGALRCGSPGSGRGSRRRRGSALIRARRGCRRLQEELWCASPAGAFDEGLEGLPRRRRCRFYEPESDNCALSSWKPASVRPVAASMTSHVTPTRRSPSTISICFRASPSARPFASPSASSCWA